MAPAPLKRKMSFATVERYEELDCLKDIYSETPNDEVLEQELREPLLYKCSALAKFLVSKNPITLLDAPVVLRAIESYALNPEVSADVGFSSLNGPSSEKRLIPSFLNA
ncbi:hypothetical protein CBS470a_013820 [Colletotrichum nupharicola]|nr:hypothetical protein CBS470a_013820 [Colletotrichum nupharicola]